MALTLTLLGVGSALPTSNRNPSAQFLQVGNTGFLIDCGEGTQMQLRKYRIGFQKIHYVFISHLHGDHYLGLMGLIWSMNLLGRQRPLVIYGPASLKSLIAFHLEAASGKLDFELIFEAVDASRSELLLSTKTMDVRSIPLKHKIPCTGFLFSEREKPLVLDGGALEKYKVPVYQRKALKEGKDFTDTVSGKVLPNRLFTKGRPPAYSYAYCSDTAYFPEVVPIINKVTVLYHEATFLTTEKHRAHRTKHSTAEEAGKIAQQAGAGRLILGHFSNRYVDLAPFLDEAKSQFESTILGEEGGVYTIEI
jgi:ribonuclease Z